MSINFRTKLLWVVSALSLLLLLRLLQAGQAYNNWPGVWYSALHILVVAFSAYLALRDYNSA